MIDKPPIGVMPEHIFEIKRCIELSRAIFEYLDFKQDKHTFELADVWVNELKTRINKIKEYQKNKAEFEFIAQKAKEYIAIIAEK